jgi:hypothetical protein
VGSYFARTLKYMAGGPSAIDGWPDLIPGTEFNAAIAASLGAALEREGFQQVGTRRWVRSAVVAIRHIVELQALKGLSYCPMWGLSLDFVPHVTGSGQVRWHRTAKSARFDLVYRPVDYELNDEASRQWAVSPFATRDELAHDLRCVTALTTAQSAPFWERARALDDLPELYADQRARENHGLPFDCFSQQRLAQAFVLARCGRPEARECLREYVVAYQVEPEAARRLHELLSK